MFGRRESRNRRTVGSIRLVPDHRPTVIDLLGDQLEQVSGQDAMRQGVTARSANNFRGNPASSELIADARFEIER